MAQKMWAPRQLVFASSFEYKGNVCYISAMKELQRLQLEDPTGQFLASENVIPPLYENGRTYLSERFANSRVGKTVVGGLAAIGIIAGATTPYSQRRVGSYLYY